MIRRILSLPTTGLPFLSMAVLILVLTACGRIGPDEAQAKSDTTLQDAVPVETVSVVRRDMAASYANTSTLEPRAESQVVAKTSGVALAVLVEEGQVVRAGQPMVRLDPDRARLALAQSEAQLSKLENQHRRARQLLGQQMISASDVDQLKYDMENLRAQHRMMALELSYTTVTAPIAGVVASRSIKPGNFVQINTPIFRIVDDARLEARLDVPERELSTLKAGQPVSLTVDALPGRSFTGVIDRVAPVVDAGSGTFRVICAFEGGEGLQPGMFARLRIEYDRRGEVLAMPRGALLEDADEPAVFAVREGRAVRVPVSLGYADGEWVEVRAGLEPGDQVVTAGRMALRDGSPVQPIGQPPTRVATTAPDGSQQ